MTDSDKLRQYADAVDELRRMQVTYSKPLNRVDREATTKQEGVVDALTALYRTPDVVAIAATSPPAT